MKKFIAVVIALSTLFGCATIMQSDSSVQPIEVFFTTALTDEGEPANQINQISITQGQVFIYVRWQMPRTQHVQLTRIRDGAGRMVIERQDMFTPSEASAYPSTSVVYAFDKNADAAGLWAFEVYIDGEKMLEKTLNVVGPRN